PRRALHSFPTRRASDLRAAGGENGAEKVAVVRTQVDDPYAALMTTPKVIVAVLTVFLLTFFFMVYGGRMQRNAIALLPSRQQKKDRKSTRLNSSHVKIS